MPSGTAFIRGVETLATMGEIKKSGKVLFVATVVRTHINEFHLPYLEWFKNQGWETHVAARNDFNNEECHIPHCDFFHDVDFARSPFSIKNLKAYRQLKKIIDNDAFDLIHCHTPVGGMLARFAARDAGKKGTKVIYTAHGFHFYKGAPASKNLIYMSFEKIAARYTDHLIVLNQEDYDAAVKYLLPKAKVTLINGIGIDLDQYNAEKISDRQVFILRGELGLSDEDILILMIAEFIPRKRHRDAIEALKKNGSKKLHILFAGTGPLLGEIKDLSEKYGLSKQVHFLGYRENIPLLIAASRATILTSGQEGMPRSVMESMAAGVAVIGADARGTRDLLSEGCGIIFPVGDTDKLSDALKMVTSNPEILKRTAEKARRRVSEYDIKKILKDHASVYAKVCGA